MFSSHHKEYFTNCNIECYTECYIGKGAKKKEKKLTSVSFMYVCVAGNGEMLVFSLLFSPLFFGSLCKIEGNINTTICFGLNF